MKKKLALCLVFILLFSSCGNDVTNQNQDIAQERVHTEIPAAGGELILAMRPALTLNPLQNSEETVDAVLKLVFEPLIRINKNFKPECALADSYSFSEDGKSVTVTLKSGLFWQNGIGITSSDIVYSLDVLSSAQDTSVYKKCIEGIVSYTRLDALSVKITFASAGIAALYSLTFPIISREYYRGNDSNSLKPMGSGPFLLSYYYTGSKLALLKNENYRDGAPYIEKVTAVISSNASTDASSFKQGITNFAVVEQNDYAAYKDAAAAFKYEYASNYYDYIGFNFEKEIFKDINVRKAVAYCVPVQNIIESIYLKGASPAIAFVNPASWLFESNVSSYEFSVDSAYALLDGGGWTDSDHDGIRNKGDEALSFTILVNEENAERREIAVKLADELNTAGFSVRIEAVDFESYSSRLAGGDYDIYIGGIVFSPNHKLSDFFGTSGVHNYSSYSSEKMDSLLAAAEGSFKPDEAVYAYSELQKYISEELPCIGIAYRNEAAFLSSELRGTEDICDNNVFSGIEKWYMLWR